MRKRNPDKFGEGRVFPDYVGNRLYYDGAGNEHREEVVLSPSNDLAIGNDLDREMRAQARLHGWYGQLTEEAKYAMKLARHRWYCLQEDLGNAIRANEDAEGLPATRRSSETAIKSKVNADPKVRQAIRKYMKLAHQYRTLQQYLDAMVARQHQLLSLNKNQRDEQRSTGD